jgi:hypothetical protein
MLGLSGGEIVLAAVALGILLFSKRFTSGLMRGIGELRDRSCFDTGKSLGATFGASTAEALTTDNQTVEIHDPAELRASPPGLHSGPKQWSIRRVMWVLGWLIIISAVVALVAAAIALLRDN